ncbi:hypothetical protein LTR09_003300 [Extremus antarcticus]|uniref:Uncharacterized protein n=1 Tax=Extremus antarcticus TaxID=702011 RepID=A0AAJ0GEN2_9PEZI|nr:hypothetical protein LTR09_003300 [Extremus antarcticus]
MGYFDTQKDTSTPGQHAEQRSQGNLRSVLQQRVAEFDRCCGDALAVYTDQVVVCAYSAVYFVDKQTTF